MRVQMPEQAQAADRMPAESPDRLQTAAITAMIIQKEAGVHPEHLPAKAVTAENGAEGLRGYLL